MNYKIILLNFATYASIYTFGAAMAHEAWWAATFSWLLAAVCTAILDHIAPRSVPNSKEASR